MWPRRLFLCALLLAAAPWAHAQPPGRVARLNFISGTVVFRPARVDTWAPASLNYPLTVGDDLWVDRGGRSELHVGATAVRLGPGTQFSVVDLDDDAIQLAVSEGAVSLRVSDLDADDVVEIDTPNGAFSVLSPGAYRIDVSPDGARSVFTVRDGDAEIATGGSSLPLQEGQQLILTGLDSPRYDITAIGPGDEWDRWSGERDAREREGVSLRYVSRDLTGWEDLDTSGRWRVTAEYGPTWFPSVTQADWAPYRYGRWAYVEPWGWTWVDDQPWGFAPFHYGRWAFVEGHWGWCPGERVARPVYAPALVAFVDAGGIQAAVSIGGGGGVGVGWLPLGPREPYIPPYTRDTTYIRQVNVTQVNITNVNIENVHVEHVNRNAPRAVTAVSRDVFVKAQPVARAAVTVQAKEIAAVRVVDRPVQVRPQAESRLAQPTIAAPAAKPPAEAMNRHVVARRTPKKAAVESAELQAGEPQAPQPPRRDTAARIKPAIPASPEGGPKLQPARAGLAPPEPAAREVPKPKKATGQRKHEATPETAPVPKPETQQRAPEDTPKTAPPKPPIEAPPSAAAPERERETGQPQEPPAKGRRQPEATPAPAPTPKPEAAAPPEAKPGHGRNRPEPETGQPQEPPAKGHRQPEAVPPAPKPDAPPEAKPGHGHNRPEAPPAAKPQGAPSDKDKPDQGKKKGKPTPSPSPTPE